MDYESWALDTFGGANLGDARRTQRLVQLASEVARRPTGVVSKACESSASREGAFRFLENDAVHWDAVFRGVRDQALRACAAHARVYVPVDGTTVRLSDRTGSKDVGAIGAWHMGARGVHAFTAFAVSSDGDSLGVCGAHFWARTQRSQYGSRGAAGRRSENSHWVDMLDEVSEAFARAAPTTQPWFQMDRGADCWQVLLFGHHRGLLLTVRAKHDRVVDGEYRHLWDTIRSQRVIAKATVNVRARPNLRKRKYVSGRYRWRKIGRPMRTAHVTLRAASVVVQCSTPLGLIPTRVNAVLVREDGYSADDRVEWMLLTTHPIATKKDVLDVVHGYKKRWHIEEFHRAWKRGLCDVERTQLRSRNAIFKWLTILAAVATRAMRLTQLARTTPDAPATSEFTKFELEAILSLRVPKQPPDDLSELTLGTAVRWIADIGGYTGPWNGPPGATIIGRGLYDVLVVARAFANRQKKR